MLLRDLEGWPPTLKETYSSEKTLAPSSPATLKRCLLFSTIHGPPAYLSLVVTFGGRDWHAMISDQPEPMLKRIEATLNGREGKTLTELGNLELLELPKA
jgi:hypothetical protein